MTIDNIDNKTTIYPVFLKRGLLDSLLADGGNEVLQKIKALVQKSFDAKITVIASQVKDEVWTLLQEHPLCRWVQPSLEKGYLHHNDLLILATDSPVLYEEIKQLAEANGILASSADTPEPFVFNISRILEKANVKTAFSTHGQSSITAKRKEDIKNFLTGDKEPMINGYQREKNLSTVKKLLIEKDERVTEEQWKKIATCSLIIFALMLLGHFIFSYLPVQELVNDTVKWYNTLDKNFHWMVLAGFLAQLVDGSLGMGYGVTSATILLSVGISPAAISGSIHTAEVFSSAASGYSHYKFGNVNKKLFKALVIPGVIGAAAGAILLTWLGNTHTTWLRALLAAYTLFLGIKFISNAFRKPMPQKKFKHYKALAGVGGFVDSFGGGGWGPLVTTTLINKGRSPKYVIGSVSLTEFFITLTSAFTFFTLLGVSHWQVIVALILGGTFAAPIAAKLAGKMPRKTAFILLGLLVIIWSLRILVKVV